MTPEQHVKYLGWSHIGYGAFFALIFGLFMVFFGLGMLAGLLNGPGPAGPPVGIFVFMMLIMTVMLAMTTLPSFIAGYGLLKGKKWAKVWAIISAVLAGGQFPMGTAVTVYTFWFLFSEPGKQYFDRGGNYALPPGRQTWANQQWDHESQRQREGQYNPPPPPPDWR